MTSLPGHGILLTIDEVGSVSRSATTSSRCEASALFHHHRGPAAETINMPLPWSTELRSTTTTALRPSAAAFWSSFDRNVRARCSSRSYVAERPPTRSRTPPNRSEDVAPRIASCSTTPQYFAHFRLQSRRRCHQHAVCPSIRAEVGTKFHDAARDGDQTPPIAAHARWPSRDRRAAIAIV